MAAIAHTPPAWRPSPAVTVAVFVLGALFVFVHHGTFAELWRVWETNDNYSHGPLVPLASAVLIWMRREKLRAIPIAPHMAGIAVVGLGCVLQVLGLRSDVFALQGGSIVVLIFGFSLTFLGASLTRAMLFPLAFLCFMLTFPPGFVNQLSFALKEITVRLSTVFAEMLGVTLQRSGMSLFLSTGELRMENPCSGLRSLISLIATGALFAHLQPGRGWRSGIMLLATIPIAVLGNAVRTTSLIVVGHYDSIEAAGGVVHDVTGYLVYAIALGALLLLRAWLTPREGDLARASVTVEARA
jgi:exosortase